METAFLAEKYQTALPYEAYVGTGTDEQQRRWRQVYEATHLTPAQAQRLAGFSRQMRMLVVSGIWCGDCVQQCPLMQRVAEGNPNAIALKFVDRDVHKELSSQLRINAGDRVPVAIFMAEDFEPCSIYGERSLNRYRALAAKQLGASCPIGVLPPDSGEVAATMSDWAGEFERIQLMLRLSPRLREKYAD